MEARCLRPQVKQWDDSGCSGPRFCNSFEDRCAKITALMAAVNDTSAHPGARPTTVGVAVRCHLSRFACFLSLPCFPVVDGRHDASVCPSCSDTPVSPTPSIIASTSNGAFGWRPTERLTAGESVTCIPVISTETKHSHCFDRERMGRFLTPCERRNSHLGCILSSDTSHNSSHLLCPPLID